ncbi:MAG TPA: cytochrome c biogenesis protein CcsA, partial [Saprospiraceae bacterium]|nr:cytochrome c biogenesis protein CcsA [Saprospiraceae bacterium]
MSYFLATQARSETEYPRVVDSWRPAWLPMLVLTAISGLFLLSAAIFAAHPDTALNVPLIDQLLTGSTRPVFQGEFYHKKYTAGAIAGFISLAVFTVAVFNLLSNPVMYWLDRFRLNTASQDGWRSLGRLSFLVHGISTLAIIGTLFFILVKKYYEYQYAWSNVSDDLPFRYTFSAFWKEQQGSFLLWSFWHVALALVVVVRAGRWEMPVMSIMMLAEAVIASMILGVYFGDFRFGASPFDLLRETMNAPIFQQKDYLSQIQGNGLNPLLQNYWMTIHPPTLFLGFASTILPFSYAVSGLWLRVHKDWLRPALRWSLFSGAILGLGILMGGAWAYEALSFGGYWAWDPVENTSLVPWITLVAGIHCNLVARSTGHSIRAAYGFYLVTFILVLYSTYLTRSGILGDSSVHAFTEMGLSVQLVAFGVLFTLAGFIPWTARWASVPQIMEQKKATRNGEETTIEVMAEEAGGSREFWMFVGALVLLFSSVLITLATSLPVWNKVVQAFWPDYLGAALGDQVSHHNRYQLWIAVFIGLLTGIAQWLRYGERNWKGWTRKFSFHIGVAVVGAGLLTALNLTWIEAHAWQFYILLFSAMFAFVANADYIVAVIKGNLKLAGSAISHLGFGILILGVLGTGLNKRWISSNTFAMDGLIEGASNDDLKKNVLLLKEAPMPIRDRFEATYLRDTIERQIRTFTVKLRRFDEQGNPKPDSFVVYPNVMYDRQFSKIVAQNPSTQHYLTHDIFTLV